MSDFESLLAQKRALMGNEKPPRARQAAEQLGITEAQYVALSCGDGVHPLKMDLIRAFFERLPDLGEVMALTRNDQIVMEHHGVYPSPVFNDESVVLNTRETDLRLKIMAWRFGFLVEENGRKSFQFFDRFGEAAHKIYITDHTDMTAFDLQVNEFTEVECPNRLLLTSPMERPVMSKALDVNPEVLRQEWRRLENVHHVNKLLKIYGLKRPEAYRHLQEDAHQLKHDSLKQLLSKAAETDLPLLMFVPNQTATQIHNGPVNKLLEMGPWFNVLDPKFNLHALLSGISESWVVKKYLDKSSVTSSVEFFNQNQEAVMMVYLHPEAREDDNFVQIWQEILNSLIDGEEVL